MEMENAIIIEKLTEIFSTIFSDKAIIITNEMTANDVENWNSLSHMLMIAEVEKSFSIIFKLKELNKIKNVGALIDLIKLKLA